MGLAFGASFAEIYKCHPNVSRWRSSMRTGRWSAGWASAAASPPGATPPSEALLADPTIDAVHLVTPIPLHEEQTVAALRAGKHCACTVPMATSPSRESGASARPSARAASAT